MYIAHLRALSAGLVAIASPAPAQERKPLVTRDRVRLNLAGAETVLEAAKKQAAALGLKCNVAVVDDGGHLLAFARMDGARPASAATALTKAVSAATFRQETGPLPAAAYSAMLMAVTEGKCYSEGEMAEALQRAGFSGVAHFPTAADRSVMTTEKSKTIH